MQACLFRRRADQPHWSSRPRPSMASPITNMISTAGASYVTVGGSNANIDELRFYPKNARMSSTCYDPLIGKISECDVNNRITYYEYDNLGRLRFIKDDYKNILKDV